MHSPTHLPLHEEPRADYVQKVTGAATFASDVEVPGMLHGKILRSMPGTSTSLANVAAPVTFWT